MELVECEGTVMQLNENIKDSEQTIQALRGEIEAQCEKIAEVTKEKRMIEEVSSFSFVIFGQLVGKEN